MSPQSFQVTKMPSSTRVKTNNKIAISSHTAIKLDKQALRSYLKPTCEYELHTLPNAKANVAKDHGKNYTKIRSSLVRHLWSNHVFRTFIGGSIKNKIWNLHHDIGSGNTCILTLGLRSPYQSLLHIAYFRN